ncbi:MAG: hypothetical protein HY672_03145 [Chloroflexi bacterium]|nr:hypothetical protein [Chloroflexota bacterium]
MGQARTKEEVLAHYAAHKAPVRFLQYDGFLCTGWDYVIQPDAEGDGIMGTETWELMHGTDVRVLIPVGTSAGDAARLLCKIAASLLHGGHWAAGGESFDEMSDSATAKLPVPSRGESAGEVSVKDLPF